MDKIDLDSIMVNELWDGNDTELIKRYLKEAIHQTLILVKKKGRVIVHPETEVDDMHHAKQYVDYMTVDEKSIDNIEKLII